MSRLSRAIRRMRRRVVPTPYMKRFPKELRFGSWLRGKTTLRIGGGLSGIFHEYVARSANLIDVNLSPTYLDRKNQVTGKVKKPIYKRG